MGHEMYVSYMDMCFYCKIEIDGGMTDLVIPFVDNPMT